jgi:hypothetical protein
MVRLFRGVLQLRDQALLNKKDRDACGISKSHSVHNVLGDSRIQCHRAHRKRGHEIRLGDPVVAACPAPLHHLPRRTAVGSLGDHKMGRKCSEYRLATRSFLSCKVCLLLLSHFWGSLQLQ